MELVREYKRDIYSNCMYIKALWKEQFEAKMLMENKIEGIVPMQTRNVDGEEYYYYDITSKQPVANLFERGQLKYEQIKAIFGGIISVIENGRKYLLSENDFILDIEYIYITLSNFNVSLCYFPGYSIDISKQFISIIEYIMDKADHNDEKAVLLVYSLYKAAKQECTLTIIKDILNKEVQVPDKVVKENDEYDYQTESIVNETVDEKNLDLEEDEKDTMINFTPYVFGVGSFIILKFILQVSWIISVSAGVCICSGVLLFFAIFKSKKKSDNDIKNDEEVKDFDLGYEFSQLPTQEENIDEYEEETMLLADYRVKRHYLIPVGEMSEEEIAISEYPFIIGKLKDKVDYVLNDDTISRMHAKIQMVDNNQLMLTDLNSKNGSFINGERLLANETKKINPGDKIAFADFEFIIK